MGKTKGGKSSGNVSAGIHKTVNKKLRNALRREYLASNERPVNQLKALKQGKDVVITIENPNREETNKRFIRQRISGKQYLANMKHGNFKTKGEAVSE